MKYLYALCLLLALSCLFSASAEEGVLVMPSGVKTVEEEAFMGDGGIKTLVLSKDAEVFSRAFADCASLVSVVAPGEDACFASDAFSGCALSAVYCDEGSGAYEYAVSNGISTHPVNEFFEGSEFLYEISPLGGLRVMGYVGTDKNIAVPAQYLGVNVTEIAEGAFRGSDRLLTAELPETIRLIGNEAFADCPSLKKVVIKEGVKHIGSAAFRSARYITEVYLPDSLMTMGENPFEHCSHLSKIVIGENNARFLMQGGALYDDYDKKLVFYPCSSSAETVTVMAGTRIIGEKAFWRATNMKKVVLPESVTEIRDYAFFECYHMQSAALPMSLTSIGSYAFSGCDSLKGIVFPESIRKIGDYAFKNCDSVGDIALPENGAEIGENIFFIEEKRTGTVMNIKPMYQFDYRKTVCTIRGEKKSVETSGCGATSMSMVIRYLKGNRTQTPHTLFTWAYKNGYYSGSGLSHYALDAFGDLYGVSTSWTKDGNKVLDALKKGYPVIAHMSKGTFTDGGHYIVLRGIDENGLILVNDPNSRERTETAYEFSLIRAEAPNGFAICKKK